MKEKNQRYSAIETKSCSFRFNVFLMDYEWNACTTQVKVYTVCLQCLLVELI